ncbi:MAG: TIGR04376 family protein [Cyanobacteriota bacterium]|nr:TIGR04376 family protein [Cyanobacteriota bacterium]
MGLFDDLSRFLETRLEEFLKAHPDLELQALDEQLRQQESDTVRLLAESRSEEQRLQHSVLATAETIKTWHLRIDKAMKANRPDLAQGARDREADLLNQGNQLWGQMKGIRERIAQMEALLRQIQERRQEVKQKLQAMRVEQQKAARSTPTEEFSGWTKPSSSWEELEKQFHDLEVEQELQKLKQTRR